MYISLTHIHIQISYIHSYVSVGRILIPTSAPDLAAAIGGVLLLQ